LLVSFLPAEFLATEKNGHFGARFFVRKPEKASKIGGEADTILIKAKS
jgi:hypothetical protein